MGEAALRRAIWIWIVVYATLTALCGIVWFPGQQDNDWTLLMWLAHAASLDDLAPLAIGHYGILQLLAARGIGAVTGCLAAAKILNAASTAVILCVVHAWLLTRTKPLMAAATTFAISVAAPVFVTAQSEFADPLALALYVVGLWLLLRDDSDEPRRYLLAGLCLGLAGATRVHMQTFAALTLICYLLVYRQPRAWSTLLLGFLGASLPVFVVNYMVHGQVTSFVASTFLGQVLFGVDPFDLPATYAAHPLGEVLREHKSKVFALVLDRCLQLPRPLVFTFVCGVVAMAMKPRREQVVVALLAAGYFFAFVALAWGVLPRVILPLVLLVWLLFGLSFHARWSVLLAAAIVALPARGEWAAVRGQLQGVRATQDQCERIDAWLLANGVSDPIQVFSEDWNLHPTHDPRDIGYYNFGYWNLLVPAFAKERPNPAHLRFNPPAFGEFLRERGVRVIIVSKGFWPSGTELTSYTLAADFGGHVAFILRP